MPSAADWLYADAGARTLKAIESLPTDQREAVSNDLLWCWEFWARDAQIPPAGDWFVWLIHSGRGFGKTRTAIETIRHWIDVDGVRTVNVAGPTWTDVMDTMVTGNDEAPGLLGVWPRHQKPDIRMSKDNPHLTAHTGATIRLRAAQKAERFRGPQADKGWCDEIDSWKPDQMSASAAFALFEMGIRLGDDPQIIATSTPKPRGLVAELRERDDCAVTQGSTWDNLHNLAPKFLKMLGRYRGTRLERQELEGNILEDADDAIVTREMIDDARVESSPDLVRTVVGVDPFGGGGDACGISATGRGVDGHGYRLADRTCKLGPDGWGRRAIETALDFEADALCVEVNFGGDMCISTLTHAAKAMGVRCPRIIKVRASRAKHLRFEPTGAMYERGQMHHVGEFSALEDELVLFTPNGYEGDASPNRVDSAVFADAELFPVAQGLGWDDLYPEESAA
jgi:phage terminase large subunit-like protein